MENAIPWDTWVVNQGWKGLRGRWMILDGRTEEGLLHGREGGGDRDGVDGRLLPRSKPTHSPRHPRPGPLTRTRVLAHRSRGRLGRELREGVGERGSGDLSLFSVRGHAERGDWALFLWIS